MPGEEKVRSADFFEISQRSAMRGRERWEVKAIFRAPNFARELEAALLRHKGIFRVSANAVSGRVLVIYSPETVCIDIGQLIRDCLEDILSKGIPKDLPLSNNASPLTRILKIAIPERGDLTGPLLLSAAEHSLSIIQDFSLVGILNTARGEGPRFLGSLGLTSLGSRLLFMTGMSLAVSSANLWFQYARRKAWQALSQSTREKLRTAVIGHIQKQDMAFFDSHGTGNLINVVTQDTAQIGEFIERAGDEIIHKSINIVASSAVLASASPRLALLVGLPLPFILLSTRYFGKMAAERYAQLGEVSGRFTQTLQNSLVGVTDVKSFTAEQQEIDRMHGFSVRMAESSIEAASVSSLQTQFAGSIASIGFLLASGYGAKMAADEEISLSDYIQVVFWFPQLLRSLAGIEQIANLYHRADHSAKELVKILDTQPRIQNGPVRLPGKASRGEVVFENVSFAYDSAKKVLNNVSFKLGPGETLAIVGPTGSGKSTLLRLLLRFYDVDSGRILLDGIDIRELNLKDLRSAVSLVSQDVHLFEGTVRENVVYGQRNVSDAQITDAMTDANAIDLVESLPGGLAAEVGERGHRLSGGERQRVAIARALLKLFRESSILALDEATSQMDNETESAIKKSLQKVTSGKSVIMIAHRLSTIRSADRILVLERGKVAEQGTHEALLEQDGLYASLWRLQSEGAFGGGLEVRISNG